MWNIILTSILELKYFIQTGHVEKCVCLLLRLTGFYQNRVHKYKKCSQTPTQHPARVLEMTLIIYNYTTFNTELFLFFGGNFTRLTEALSLYSIIKLEHNIKMSLTLQSSQENPFFWLDYADVNYILYFRNWVLWERRERIIISLSVSGVFCHQWYSRRVPLQGSDVQGWQYEESGGIREIKKAPPCQMYPNERDNGQVVDAKCIVPPVNCEKKREKRSGNIRVVHLVCFLIKRSSQAKEMFELAGWKEIFIKVD